MFHHCLRHMDRAHVAFSLLNLTHHQTWKLELEHKFKLGVATSCGLQAACGTSIQWHCGLPLRYTVVFFKILQFLSFVDKNVRVLVQILCNGFVWRGLAWLGLTSSLCRWKYRTCCCALVLTPCCCCCCWFFIFLSQRSSMGCITKTHTSGWRLKATSALLVSPITHRYNARNIMICLIPHISLSLVRSRCIATYTPSCVKV